MPLVDMTVLTPHVQAILADPSTVPVTDDAALDAALAQLAQRRRARQPLVGSHGLALFWNGAGPWNGEGQRADAHAE